MPAGSTYTPIATTTLGSAQADYTFTSIPSTYTDLKIVCSVGSSNNLYSMALQFNSDTTTNYSSTELRGTGTTANSSNRSNIAKIYVCDNITPSLTLGENTIIIDVFNYANTTTFKTILSRENTMGGSYRGTGAIVGLWRKTPEAITSIKLSMDGVNFVSGSTFTLYGIAAA
jgi:hypothetical protein